LREFDALDAAEDRLHLLTGAHQEKRGMRWKNISPA
jgi:hypothetical protein